MTKKVWIVSDYVNKNGLNDSMDKSAKEPNTPVTRKYLITMFIIFTKIYEQENKRKFYPILYEKYTYIT